MAQGGHICCENYEFIGVKGPAPMFACNHGPNLRHGDMEHVARSGHTLRTASSGSILEFTYLGRLAPSLITGHGQVSCPGKQRSMTCNELTQGMALTGHILLGNHTVNNTEGLALASAFSSGLDLRPGGLDPVIHDGQTLRTPDEGCIPESTHIGGLASFLTTGHDQDCHLGSQRSMAHGELARGGDRSACTLLGNHEIAQTDGSTLVTGSYPVQAHHMGKLEPMVEPHPGQRLHPQ
jgi:hypothetical protein